MADTQGRPAEISFLRGAVANPTAQRDPQGFTLVEVIVVVAILAMLATMVVPRMAGISRQRGEIAIENTASILAAFAFHDSTGGMPIALSYDGDFRQLELQILEPDPESSTGRPSWRVHPFTQPYTLPDDVEISSISSDGEPLNPEDFFITSRSAGDRPAIELRLESTGQDASIVLSPYALAPVVNRTNDEFPVIVRERADLDEMGLDREDW